MFNALRGGAWRGVQKDAQIRRILPLRIGFRRPVRYDNQ
jgi:hypothetical protein